jgi:hypothetical protein
MAHTRQMIQKVLNRAVSNVRYRIVFMVLCHTSTLFSILYCSVPEMHNVVLYGIELYSMILFVYVNSYYSNTSYWTVVYCRIRYSTLLAHSILYHVVLYRTIFSLTATWYRTVHTVLCVVLCLCDVPRRLRKGEGAEFNKVTNPSMFTLPLSAIDENTVNIPSTSSCITQ